MYFQKEFFQNLTSLRSSFAKLRWQGIRAGTFLKTIAGKVVSFSAGWKVSACDRCEVLSASSTAWACFAASASCPDIRVRNSHSGMHKSRGIFVSRALSVALPVLCAQPKDSLLFLMSSLLQGPKAFVKRYSHRFCTGTFTFNVLCVLHEGQ